MSSKARACIIAPHRLRLLSSSDAPSLASSSAVFLDDMRAPVLTVPFAAASFLRQGSSDAYVGLTASTGDFWQAVDILSWNASGAAVA